MQSGVRNDGVRHLTHGIWYAKKIYSVVRQTGRGCRRSGRVGAKGLGENDDPATSGAA